MEDLFEAPVKVKLLTLWMKDNEYADDKVCKYSISHGIWETIGVFIHNGRRAFNLRCVWPMHKDLKIGDTRKMSEDALIMLSHQVEITHLPKLNFSI